MSEDSVADDMLRAFADRIEIQRKIDRTRHYAELGRIAPDREQMEAWFACGRKVPKLPKGSGTATEDAERWLYICAVLCRPASEFDHETRRGWVITCRLLGLSWSRVQDAISDVQWFGAHEAAKHWAPFLTVPDRRYIGRVYLAQAANEPEIFKIGFSTNVPKRMVQLSRETGTPVVALQSWEATMLHEWALHMRGRFEVRPEWYRREGVPAILFEKAEAA